MISTTALLITISSLLALASYFVYIVAILKGKAKPHRTTRFVTVFLTALATASLFAEKSTAAIWMPAMFTLGSLVIFGLSIKYGMGGSSKTDLLCLVVALIGIIFWKVTNNPLYGLYASMGADFVGNVPMIIKTYRYPGTEVRVFYFISFLAAIFSLLALQDWSVQEYSYPFYIIFIDLTAILLISRFKLLNYGLEK